MMDYEVFKNVVTERIKEFLPPLYAAFDQHIHRVPKINGCKEALILELETVDKRLAAPNIYLDDLYEKFKKSGDLDKVIEEAAMVIMSFTGTQTTGDTDIDNYKEDIVLTLVNTAQNEELLASAPHRDFLDLSVIYRFAVEDGDKSGFATALITSDLQEELGLTDAELNQLAEENSERKLNTKILKLSDDVMVMTTEQVIYGAINLMRKDKLRDVAESMDDDLYIFAGSMHEIVVVKSSSSNRNFIIESLRKESGNLLQKDDFLSDSVYFYDRKENRVERILR